ncbi:MAG: class I SAM-dependent rRNA methyltransferase [Crocinitomicaceae bacterium]|nr:class I SAM-dependent rRNA methyltransferase [Crocinitomicaceae bacterium]
MKGENQIQSKTVAVKLSEKAEKLVKKGHPWVFSDSIQKINAEVKTGAICVLFSNRDNKFYALGLYDKNSPIRIKIISRVSTKLDQAFFNSRIVTAYDLRQPLISESTNSFRLVYGENDYLPGVIVDVYHQVAVLKLYSAIWLPFIENITTAINETLNTKAIVLRFSRNIQKECAHLTDGSIITGLLDDENVRFLENNVHFTTNVIKGHKTGFFLDHRPNRKRIGELAKNKKVLDVFSYVGGFSVHALVGGAKEVTSVDISQQALDVAKENAKINTFSGKHHTLAGDAFEVLGDLVRQKQTFDLIIIDPPSFAKSTAEVKTALKKYYDLALLGIQLTAKKGILVLASCSSRVSKDELTEIHQQAFAATKTTFELTDMTTHDIDHPIVIKEAEYLKCMYYQRD